MTKTPLEMDYNELNTILDSLLTSQNLPSSLYYKGDHINYRRQQRLRILFTAVKRLFQAQRFYMKEMKTKINALQTTGTAYHLLKQTRCLKNLRTYLYLSKIGLTDISSRFGGRFNDQIFADFSVATMLYDAAFDIPYCQRYLKDFDHMIMTEQPIESTDPYLRIFQESVDHIQKSIPESTATEFFTLIKIEHISQLMSIYQQSDKHSSKDILLKITFAKGGISGLALMLLMAPKMTPVQRRVIYELGAVLQLVDDISDITEDTKAGIQTLPNQRLISYQELKELYYGTINNLIDVCHMNPEQPNETLDMLCWFADIILEKRYKRFAVLE